MVRLSSSRGVFTHKFGLDQIWNRFNLISDYSRERYLKLDDLLRKARDNEQERVKKKAEEMERKYDQ